MLLCLCGQLGPQAITIAQGSKSIFFRSCNGNARVRAISETNKWIDSGKTAAYLIPIISTSRLVNYRLLRRRVRQYLGCLYALRHSLRLLNDERVGQYQRQCHGWLCNRLLLRLGSRVLRTNPPDFSQSEDIFCGRQIIIGESTAGHRE